MWKAIPYMSDEELRQARNEVAQRLDSVTGHNKAQRYEERIKALDAERAKRGRDVLVAVKEHRIVYGLTDHEVSVLQGALQERAESYPDDALACQGMEAILLDQLGPETADECGWEVLRSS